MTLAINHVEQGQAPGAVVEEWLGEGNKTMKVERDSSKGSGCEGKKRERKEAGG